MEENLNEGNGNELPPPPPKKEVNDAVGLPPPPKKKTGDTTTTELSSSSEESDGVAPSISSNFTSTPKEFKGVDNQIHKKYDLSKVYDFNKDKGLSPDELQLKASQDLTKKLAEQRKPEAIKKADKLMKAVDTQIVDVSRNINDIKSAQKTNLETLDKLKKEIDDPLTDPQVKPQLIEVYNNTLNNAQETAKTGKVAWDKAVALQRSKSTLNKVYEVQEKLDMDQNDDALKATGNFLSHVYNAIPETISGLGSLVESAGDVDLMPLPNTPEERMRKWDEANKNDKITDIIGNGIRSMGNDLKAETDAKYDDKHYITSTIGDIVGSVAVAAIPGSMAAKSGKVAQIVSGATTATMQMADGVHQKAKDAGLSDADAGMMTLTIAPISGLLEVWGASNIIDNVAGKKIINELVSESTKKLAGKTITKDLILNTVGDTFKDISKKYGLNALKSGAEEGLTNAAQAEVEKGAENIYDVTHEKPAYGTKFFSAKEQLDVAKQGALGAVAGSAFGILSGISSPKSIYEKALQLKEEPDQLEKFRSMLDTEVKAEHITQEESDNIKANINAMMAADERVPPTITDKNKRFKAVELIKEKTALETEIKGLDKTLTTPQRDKIKAINSELEAIATGKEPVKMERKDLGKKGEVVTEKTQEEEVKLPLTKDEIEEFKSLSRDNKRIGLEGDDLKRYEELKNRNNDKTNISGVQSDLRIGKESKQTEPNNKSGEKKVETDRVLQTSNEIPFNGETVTQSKDEYIAEQKNKLKEDDSFNEAMDKDGVYDRIFSHKYDLAHIREERVNEAQQNEEKDVKPIKEEEYADLATEIDQQPEHGEINARAEAINSEAESTGESIRSARDEGKDLSEEEITKMENEQHELLKDIDHVITTPQRIKKKNSRITKLLSEKPSSIREAALHYYLGGGQVRKADVERIVGKHFTKADWGKNNTLFNEKSSSLDIIAKEKLADLLGRELTPDEEIQAGEELADIALNNSNKNNQFNEAKSYREQAKEDRSYQEMNAVTASMRETESDFLKSVEMFYDIKDAEGGTKKRNLAEKRRAFMESHPAIKYIDDNMHSIYSQLEKKGLLTKTGDCP